MGELVKLKIVGYETQSYSESKKSGDFTTQVNPTSMKLGKTLNYQLNGEAKGVANLRKFSSQALDSLSFEILMDDTGIIPNKSGKIKDRINQLEKAIYRINSESHEPSYVKVIWGTFIFRGRVETINYDYSLFSPSGVPLRVKVSFSFNGYFDKDTAQMNSPDLSRVITFRAGDSIARYCDEIYGDASFCHEIAAYNNLSEFRKIEPGTKISFPPLATR
ncbi:hypothetical protein D3C71_406420 [compost metagenome]